MQASMYVVGELSTTLRAELEALMAASTGLLVSRPAAARSDRPLPQSQDLERALRPLLEARDFVHQWRIPHALREVAYWCDFHRPEDGVSIEVMGYRADDEVYKDILKFQVHTDTRIGVLWVPRWKWVSGRRGPTNINATLKALEFAYPVAHVGAMVAVPYDWTTSTGGYVLTYD